MGTEPSSAAGPPPGLRVTSVTIGSPQPREAAAFWARLTGWAVRVEEEPGPDEPPEGGWAQVGPRRARRA